MTHLIVMRGPAAKQRNITLDYLLGRHHFVAVQGGDCFVALLPSLGVSSLDLAALWRPFSCHVRFRSRQDASAIMIDAARAHSDQAESF
jgi:hypothetical protein